MSKKMGLIIEGLNRQIIEAKSKEQSKADYDARTKYMELLKNMSVKEVKDYVKANKM